jgi:hypothetical protein
MFLLYLIDQMCLPTSLVYFSSHLLFSFGLPFPLVPYSALQSLQQIHLLKGTEIEVSQFIYNFFKV